MAATMRHRNGRHGWNPRVRAALVAAAGAALLTGLVAGQSAQAQSEVPNLVSNGGFEPGVHNQWWNITDDDVTDGELCLDVPGRERFGNFVDLGLEEGETYVYGFTAHGDPGTGNLQARIQSDGSLGPEVFDVLETFEVSPEPQAFEWSFTATGDAQRVQFEMSGADPASTFC